MAEISHDLNRRVGLLVDRAGRIEAVAVGEAHRRRRAAPAERPRGSAALLHAAFRGHDAAGRGARRATTSRRSRCTGSMRSPSSRSNRTAAPGAVRVAHLLARTGDAARRSAPVGEPTGPAVPRGFVRPEGAPARRARRAHGTRDVVDGRRALPPPPTAPGGACRRGLPRADPRARGGVRPPPAAHEARRGKVGRAILVHVTTGSRAEAEASMSELEELAASADLQCRRARGAAPSTLRRAHADRRGAACRI